VAAHGRVFIVAPDNIMTALDAGTGAVVWRQRAPGLRVRESMGLSEDSSLVWVKTMDGVVIGVSTSGPALNVSWQSDVRLGYELSPTRVLEDKGTLYVPTHSGTVWAIARDSGKLLWRYKASSCMVNGILPAGEGRIVISTMDGKMTCVTVHATQVSP
jgi:outer membrane protein assembly factor BamB